MAKLPRDFPQGFFSSLEGILCVLLRRTQHIVIFPPYRISELEERLQVAEKHRFPDFFRMHWDAAKNIIAEVEDFNTLSQRCPG